MAEVEIKPGGPVLRLRIRWQAGQWDIVKRIKLSSKTLPRHRTRPETPPGVELSGFWYEAVSADGQVLYRWVMENPIAPNAEVVDEKGNMSRVDTSRAEIFFEALIPDLPEVAELRLYANPDPFTKNRHSRGGDQSPVAVFKLDKEEHARQEKAS